MWWAHTRPALTRMPAAQAVLVNAGWEAEGADAAARLAKVPLPRLVPVGFVFVWAQKQHVAALVRQLYRWGFCYIENLTWVQMAANNTVLTLPAAYAQRSHLTLLIFRKDGAPRPPHSLPQAGACLAVMVSAVCAWCEVWQALAVSCGVSRNVL